MTEKTKSDEALKPYPDDSEGLSPTVKTVDPERPEQGEKPHDDQKTSSRRS